MEVCLICSESLGNCKIHTTKCSHSYHKECLDKWLISNNTCPICRTKIEEIDTNGTIMGVSAPHPIYKQPFRTEMEMLYETHVCNEEKKHSKMMVISPPIYTYAFTPEGQISDKKSFINGEKSVINKEKSVKILKRDPQIKISEQDIDIIISQTFCTRERAVASLINNDYDIVNAIMDIAFVYT
jgi:NACalpha-BTF3-like transcription factor